MSTKLAKELTNCDKLADIASANANSPTKLKSILKTRRNENLQKNAIIVTNTFLLYFLSTFLWIFRLFLRQILREEKLNMEKDEKKVTANLYQFFGFGTDAANCRRQRAAAKIAASKDKMSTSTASSSASSASGRSATESAKAATNPCRSVTLKACVSNKEAMQAALFDLTDAIGHVTRQEDVFFNVPYGQMKLRVSHSAGKDKGELISYKQTNNTGPNFSESRVTPVSDAPYLRTTLALSLTELGTISKERRVYEYENVQICLDDVEGLGCFVDIDVRCDGSDKQSAETLLKQIEKIKKALNIEEHQLVPYSYFELMRQQQQTQQQKLDHNNGSDVNSVIDEQSESNNNNRNENNNGNNNNHNGSGADDAESGISEGGSYVS